MTPPGSLRARLGGVYYGWWVVLATFILGVFSGGIFAFSNAIYFRPIRRDLELSYSQTALIFSLSRAEGSIAGPIVGRLVDRFGARPMIIGGGIMASLGFMMLHWVDTYWLFLLIFIVIVSTGKSAGLGQTLLSSTNRWFVRRRALAMSITIIGFSSGGAVIMPLVNLGVSTIGWQDVMLYSGIFMIFLTVPLGMMVRHSPESMGIEPEGVDQLRQQESFRSGGAAALSADPDFSVKEAMGTRAFWLLFWASVLRITVWGAISVHAVEMIVKEDVSATTAGFLVSLMFFLSIPMRLVVGALGVRLPTQPFLAGAMAAAGLAMVSLLTLDGLPAVYLFVVLMALEQGGTTLNWVVLGDYFGRRSFATIFGIMSTFFNIGMIASAQYAGWIADRHDGSYNVALLTFAPLYGLSALLFLNMRQPALPRRRTDGSAG